MAIQGFSDKEARHIFEGRFSRKLPQPVQRKIRMKLLQLHSAVALGDLRVPPSNRLEMLSGDRKGQYSIRVNVQYRLCFQWKDGNAFNVEVVDYH